jgi:AraC-like DNA-binding protein
MLFGQGFDAPLWAAVLGEGQVAGRREAAGASATGVLLATPSQGEAFVRSGSSEWVLRRGDVLVARGFGTIAAGGGAPVADPGLLVIGFQLSVLASLLEPFRPGLLEPVRRSVYGTEGQLASILPLRAGRGMDLVASMLRPPVGGAALPFWYEGHIKAMLASACFGEAPAEPREFFCSRQRRLAEERIETAKGLLGERIDEILNLQELADAAGCSPSYLSRTFSAATGLTLSQYHRKLRIERAAELLAAGRCNVSEAAVEVGYQSLSHFSKAFREVMGCAPSAYAA